MESISTRRFAGRIGWIRATSHGPLIIKGILDPDDAPSAVHLGADGIVVSNHGSRQLDGVLSSTRVLPDIVDAVQDRLTVLGDWGVPSGLDVVRMSAMGAKEVLLGRAWLFALAVRGGSRVMQLFDLMATETRVAMALVGARCVGEIGRSMMVG